MGLTFKETGRITINLFMKLYDQYKNNFDLEMRLKAANMTYGEAEQKTHEHDEWF